MSATYFLALLQKCNAVALLRIDVIWTSASSTAFDRKAQKTTAAIVQRTRIWTYKQQHSYLRGHKRRYINDQLQAPS